MNRNVPYKQLQLKKRARDLYHRILNRVPSQKIKRSVKNRPFLSFFLTLFALFVLIILGSLLTPQPEETPESDTPTPVRVYGIGTGPVITTQAQIQKTGVINIYAQTAGIVQEVHVTEGEEVVRGTRLISLSTNYQGGNAPAIQSSVASRQYQNANETFETQKELIQKQREVANKTDENTDKLREISEQSVGETRDLLNLNENMLSSVNDLIETLENADADQSEILPLQQQQAQLQAATNQLKNTLRTAEYQTNTNNPPTTLSDLQREITLKQLDVQEKSLQLGLDVARLQLQLAQVQASLMSPTSPSNGIVQRVHVTFGQSVSPGTLLVSFFQPDHEITAVTRIRQDIATRISRSQMSILRLADGTVIRLAPRFVSTEATDGILYAAIYTIPQEYSQKLTNQEFISVEIPLTTAETTGNTLIPIDAVYKTDDEAFVFVVENGVAISKTITVGQIVGSYIQVHEGLKDGDMVILDRNIIEGERVDVLT